MGTLISATLGTLFGYLLALISFSTLNGHGNNQTQTPPATPQVPNPTPAHAGHTHVAVPPIRPVHVNIHVHVPQAQPAPVAQPTQPIPAPAPHTPIQLIPLGQNYPWLGWVLGGLFALVLIAGIILAFAWYANGDTDRKIREVASMGGNTLVREEVLPVDQQLPGTTATRHFFISRDMRHVLDSSAPHIQLVVRDGWKVRVIGAQGNVIRDYSKGEKVALHPSMTARAYEYAN